MKKLLTAKAFIGLWTAAVLALTVFEIAVIALRAGQYPVTNPIFPIAEGPMMAVLGWPVFLAWATLLFIGMYLVIAGIKARKSSANTAHLTSGKRLMAVGAFYLALPFVLYVFSFFYLPDTLNLFCDIDDFARGYTPNGPRPNYWCHISRFQLYTPF